MNSVQCRSSIAYHFSGVRALAHSNSEPVTGPSPSTGLIAHDYKLNSSWTIVPSPDFEFHAEQNNIKASIHQLISKYDAKIFQSVVDSKPISTTSNDFDKSEDGSLEHKYLSLEGFVIDLFNKIQLDVLSFSKSKLVLCLDEGLRRRVTYDGTDQVVLMQSYKMNCIHRHMSPELSDQENQSLYYNCANLHGHEYQLEISLKAAISETSPEVLNEADFNHRIQTHILDPYHRKYLNDFFGNSSGEIIAQHLVAKCKEIFPDSFHSLTLKETMKNSFHAC